MFLKPFRVKSNTQMKGSDKKKLKAELKKRFPYLVTIHLAVGIYHCPINGPICSGNSLCVGFNARHSL